MFDACINHTEAMIGSSVSKPFPTVVHLLDIGYVMFTHYNSNTFILECLMSVLYFSVTVVNNNIAIIKLR